MTASASAGANGLTALAEAWVVICEGTVAGWEKLRMARAYPSTALPNVEVDAIKVVSTHPNTALNGLAAINTHAMVESLLLKTFSGLLGRQKAYGFGSIIDKEKEFQEVAKLSLSGEDFALFEWSLNHVKKSRDNRDTLVNSLWALDASFPDDIVLVDQESVNDTSDSIQGAVDRKSITVESATEIQDTMRSGFSLWNADDMGKFRSIAVQAMSAIISLDILISSTDEGEKSNSRHVINNIISSSK